MFLGVSDHIVFILGFFVLGRAKGFGIGMQFFMMGFRDWAGVVGGRGGHFRAGLGGPVAAGFQFGGFQSAGMKRTASMAT
jgi:hypothetical protein